MAVVTTMGSAAPWSRLSNFPLDFPAVGSAMGHTADLAMGLARAQPQGAGLSEVYEFDNAQEMARDLLGILTRSGPIFVNLRIETGHEPPPNLDPLLRKVVSGFRKAFVSE